MTMDSIRALLGNPWAYAADVAYQAHLYRVGDALDSVGRLILAS